MTELTENTRTGDFLLSEGNGSYSRENVILAAGENLQAGAVVAYAAATGKYQALDPAAEDGTQDAAGVLWATTHATEDTAVVIISRTAEVKADALQWPDGITTQEKTTAIAQLAELGIVLR